MKPKFQASQLSKKLSGDGTFMNVAEFLDLVAKSGLVDSKLMHGYVQSKQRLKKGNRPEQLAKALITDGLLTNFQAEQLLQGKWRGFMLKKYRILEVLGCGGMGRVYLCEHTLMNRLVALKILPQSEEPQLVERFYREAQAVAALDHPNIVRAYDVDHDSRYHFIIMEYVDGRNLQDLVEGIGPLDIVRACHYIAQAAAGLQHAHLAGWIHRDIKPGNLLVDRQGVIKILDLGLARFFLETKRSITQRYDENSIVGTADYLAPEQALHHATIDIRVDIYSLGATFYFLLLGRAPFEAENVAQKLLAHHLREPDSIREQRPEVPKKLAAILSKMMAKDPDRRFADPEEVMVALEPWTREPIAAPLAAEMPNTCPRVTMLLTSAASTRPLSRTGIRIDRVISLKKAEKPGVELLSVRRWNGKVLWIGLGAGLVVMIFASWAGWQLFRNVTAVEPRRQAERRDGTPPKHLVIPPNEAGEHVNEICTLELVIRHTGLSKNQKMLFLNSELDFASKTNLTLVCHALEKFKDLNIEDPATYFRGKRVQITGPISLYNDRPQIVVSNLKDIKVLEE